MSYGNYPDLSSVKKVLIIKLRHLGDVLLSSPVFTTLKQALPEAKIDAYVYEESLPMLEGHLSISHIFSYDRSIKKLPLFSRLKKEWQLLRTLKKQNYDLVINLTEGDRGAIVAKMTKAPIRLGFDGEGKGFKKKNKIYTHLIKKTSHNRHVVEQDLDAIRRLGISPSIKSRELSFFISQNTYQKVNQSLKKENLSEKNYLLIHPASRWKFKCWPPLLVRELITSLLEKGHSIVISSGQEKEELEMVDNIIKDLPVVSFAGKTSIKELGALIALSRATICVDSVSLHLTSALKTPAIALFGPSSPVKWGPWKNPYAKVVTQNLPCQPCYSDGCGGSKISDCLHTLSPQKVLEAIEEILSLSSHSISQSTTRFSTSLSKEKISPLKVLTKDKIKITELKQNPTK